MGWTNRWPPGRAVQPDRRRHGDRGGPGPGQSEQFQLRLSSAPGRRPPCCVPASGSLPPDRRARLGYGAELGPGYAPSPFTEHRAVPGPGDAEQGGMALPPRALGQPGGCRWGCPASKRHHTPPGHFGCPDLKLRVLEASRVRGQGCCQTSYNVQHWAPTTNSQPTPNVNAAEIGKL